MLISILQGDKETTIKCKALYFDRDNHTIEITINDNELYGVDDELQSKNNL